MMLLLLTLFGNLITLSCDAPLPCDCCHDLFIRSPMVPSHDDFLAHASWWSNCSKLWCFSCSCLIMVQLFQAMMLLLLLFHNSLVAINSWYSCFFFHDVFISLVFFAMLLSSCFLTYQSHSRCDPLLLPPTSCSFNYEFGGCKHAGTCPFAWCLAVTTCLTTHCAFVVNPMFTPQYPNGCGCQPIWNSL